MATSLGWEIGLLIFCFLLMVLFTTIYCALGSLPRGYLNPAETPTLSMKQVFCGGGATSSTGQPGDKAIGTIKFLMSKPTRAETKQ